TEPEIDTARIQPRQRAELLGDDIGRVVRQHDAPGADPDRLRAARYMGDDDRCGGAGDALHVVMFCHPDALVAPLLGMGSKVPCIVECCSGVRVLGDADQFENGKGGHCSALPAAERSMASITSCSATASRKLGAARVP